MKKAPMSALKNPSKVNKVTNTKNLIYLVYFKRQIRRISSHYNQGKGCDEIVVFQAGICNITVRSPS